MAVFEGNTHVRDGFSLQKSSNMELWFFFPLTGTEYTDVLATGLLLNTGLISLQYHVSHQAVSNWHTIKQFVLICVRRLWSGHMQILTFLPYNRRCVYIQVYGWYEWIFHVNEARIGLEFEVLKMWKIGLIDKFLSGSRIYSHTVSALRSRMCECI